MDLRSQFLTLAVLPTICVASLLHAQSLGDVARATRENRMKVMQQKSVRIWTNDNMPRAPRTVGPTAAAGISAEPVPSPAPSESNQAAAAPEAAAAASEETKTNDDKSNDRDYWQGAFKAVRQKIAADEEQQRVSEDELSLLQIEQARELAPDRQTELDTQVKAKTSEVEGKREQTTKDKKALESLEKEFKDSGAPAEWSKPQ